MPVEEIQDGFISHGLNLNAFTNKEADALKVVFSDLSKDLSDQIHDSEIAQMTYRKRKLAILKKQADLTVDTAYNKMYENHSDVLVGVTLNESEESKLIMNDALGVEAMTTTISPAQAVRIANNTLIQGEVNKKWWSSQTVKTKNNYLREVRMGMLAGETTDDIARRIAGRFTGTYETVKLKNGKTRRIGKRSGGVMQTSFRNAEALVRTSVQTVANEARLQTFKENDDVIKGMELIVTLDGNTTEICISRSGGAWNLQTGEPLPDSAVNISFPGAPPYHWRCFIDPDTPIYTDQGWKRIVDIEVGDFVLTHKDRFRKVTELLNTPNQMPEVMEISVELYYGDITQLIITVDHPVMTNHEWKASKLIEVGDTLTWFIDADRVVIQSEVISISKRQIVIPTTLYNFAVEEDESYIAKGFVVHNCRSALLPVVKAWDELGSKALAKFKEAPKGMRASMDGLVPADLTYSDWLRRKEVKDPGFADKVLGKGKAKLWREGKITTQQLVNASGKPFTLAELKKKTEKQVFVPKVKARSEKVWLASLDDSQKTIIKNYSSGGYRDYINAQQMAGSSKTLTKYQNLALKRAGIMEDAIESYPVVDKTLHRGLAFDKGAASQGNFNKVLAKYKKGSKVEFDQLSSFSSDRDTALYEYAQLNSSGVDSVLFSVKGKLSHAAEISDLAVFASEKEIVLNSKQRLLVSNVTKKKIKGHTVHVIDLEAVE